MSTNKLYCLGDGYAYGHIWPEWPQILQVLLPSYEVKIISAVGAGAEFLISELLANNVADSAVIFQWPQDQRFDKLVTDNSWANIIDNDPVYHFNCYQGQTGKWWCSSASDTEEIKTYHEFYVSVAQHNLRNKNYKKLLTAYLQQNNCQWLFTSTQEQERFIQFEGFRECRGNEIQPSPLAHFYFVVKKILPALSLPVDAQRIDNLESEIKNTNWTAYDPDRKEIWDNLVCRALDQNKVDHNGFAQGA